MKHRTREEWADVVYNFGRWDVVDKIEEALAQARAEAIEECKEWIVRAHDEPTLANDMVDHFNGKCEYGEQCQSKWRLQSPPADAGGGGMENDCIGCRAANTFEPREFLGGQWIHREKFVGGKYVGCKKP